jgi:hypothetical protein
VIDRKSFHHWGMLPHWTDDAGYGEWLTQARAFGRAFWDALGDKQNPTIVFEHPGEATVPTSGFVCETGGMVVICAGTSGYNATLDLRYHWMRQKRFQGSHFANDDQAKGRERPGHRPEGRPVPVPHLRLRGDRRLPPADAREPPPERQHGHLGQRQAARAEEPGRIALAAGNPAAVPQV